MIKVSDNKGKCYAAFLTMLLVSLCFLHAVDAGEYVNFFPINGTFQNYNPVRRFLDGQTPYKDFQDYLGMGHLYMGAIFTLIFGRDYQASLVAFSFLTIFSFALIISAVGYCVTKNGVTSLVVANMMLVLNFTRPLFFTNFLVGDDVFLSSFNAALDTGLSARLTRGMIVPISCMLALALMHLFAKIKCNMNIIPTVQIVAVGLVAGISFLWSNDFGISCWVCLALMTFITAYCRTKSVRIAVSALALEMICAIISILFFAFILTQGQLEEWLHSLIGTGGYQSWYYNSAKAYYIWQIDMSYYLLLQAALVLYYLYRLFRERGSEASIRRYGTLAFFNMVCFCAANEYRLLSGETLHEVPFLVLFATLLFEAIKLLSILTKGNYIGNKLSIFIAICCVVFLTFTTKEKLAAEFERQKDGIYIDELDGNITSLGEDLLRTTDFIGEGNVFSTYASAQEVLLGTFQPSGTDYIIHVLGDSARENYLQAFTEGEFQYTATIQESYSDWEAWIRRANWFFYRELYQNWHPVYDNSYLKLWERNSADETFEVKDNIRVEVIPVSEEQTKIAVYTDEGVSGTADVFIDYTVNKKDTLSSKLLIRRLLQISDMNITSSQNHNYLGEESAEYIPVEVVNGYGEVVLTSMPMRDTYLELNSATCTRIFTVLYHQPLTLANITDENWTNGVSNTSNTLLFPNTDAVKEKLLDAKWLSVDANTVVEIEEVVEQGTWIHVTCSGENLQEFAYPNIISES